MTQTADCLHKESCLGAQPIFVGHGNPRFHYARSGYIPFDCPCPGYEPEPKRIEQVDRIWTGRQWDEVEQVKALFQHLDKKLTKFINKKIEPKRPKRPETPPF